MNSFDDIVQEDWEKLKEIIQNTEGIEIIDTISNEYGEPHIWYITSEENDYSNWNNQLKVSESSCMPFVCGGFYKADFQEMPLLSIAQKIHYKLGVGVMDNSETLDIFFPNLENRNLGSVAGNFDVKYRNIRRTNEIPLADEISEVLPFRVFQVLDERLLDYVKNQTSNAEYRGFEVYDSELQEVNNILKPDDLCGIMKKLKYKKLKLNGLTYHSGIGDFALFMAKK